MQITKLSFYTNIPTPYQDDFFNALHSRSDFKAVFYAKTEVDRSWTLRKVDYVRVFLQSNFISKLIQLKFKDFHFSLEIIKQAWNDNSDWIILGGNYFALNNLIASIILKFKNKKTAFYSERLKPDNKFWMFLKKQYLRLFLANIDLLICVGNSSCESYNRLGFTKKVKISIPYNIDINSFCKEKLNPSKLKYLKDSLQLNGKIILLSSGALEHRKGMDIAIETFQKLYELYPGKISLIILGEGPEKEKLIFASNFAPSDIHLVGFKQRDEVAYYYGIADIFLFCSRYDGWGLVINEAMASGCGLVCSDAVGSCEWIEDGLNGIVVESENVCFYVSALEKLINNPLLLEQMQIENSRRSFYTSSDYFANYLLEILNTMNS